MSVDLSRHPLCAERLRINRTNINEDAMNAYWAALCVAEDYGDKRLTQHGGIDFWTMDGPALLDAMEGFLAQRNTGRVVLSKQNFERLKAYFGAQGMKAGKMSHADFWSAARTLWPDHISGDASTEIGLLLHQIDSMPKRLRRSIARKNRHRIGGVA